MAADSFEARVERLRSIRWGNAASWDDAAEGHLLDYYEKVLPFWPDDATRRLPSDDVFIDAFLTRLSPSERERVDQECAAVAAPRPPWEPPPLRTTQALMRLILACGLLIDRAALDPEDDPSSPLLRLFEAGYELHPTHGAVDVCFADGMATVTLPSRRQIAARSSK